MRKFINESKPASGLDEELTLVSREATKIIFFKDIKFNKIDKRITCGATSRVTTTTVTVINKNIFLNMKTNHLRGMNKASKAQQSFQMLGISK